MGGQGSMAWERLRKRNESDLVMGVLLSPFAYFLLGLGILALVEWAGWLRWPMIILLGVLFLAAMTGFVQQVRVHMKRADTATQSIRAASQGRIELIGTLKSLEGEVISPLYAVPCVSWLSRLSASAELLPSEKIADRPVVRFSESMSPPAVLLTDGEGAEVFLPFLDENVQGMEIEIDRPDEPRSLLREDLRKQMEMRTFVIGKRLESLVPCGKLMQANAVLSTLSSTDSYLRAVHARRKLPEPSEEQLRDDKVEQAWRRYCRAREEKAGAAPVPVNALLPLDEIGGVRIVRQTFASWRETAFIIGMMVMLGAACAFMIGALFYV